MNYMRRCRSTGNARLDIFFVNDIICDEFDVKITMTSINKCITLFITDYPT